MTERPDDIAELIAMVPYAQFLGMRVEDRGGALVATMPFAHELVGNPHLPALHGGTLGALLESIALFQVMWELEHIIVPRTVNITVDYLRSARALDTYASATVTRRGRRIANVRAEAWQSEPGQPVAAAHCHFLVDSDEPAVS